MKKFVVVCLLFIAGLVFTANPAIHSTAHAQSITRSPCTIVDPLPPPQFPEVHYVMVDGSFRPFKIINGGEGHTCAYHFEDSPVDGLLFHDPADDGGPVEKLTGVEYDSDNTLAPGTWHWPFASRDR